MITVDNRIYGGIEAVETGTKPETELDMYLEIEEAEPQEFIKFWLPAGTRIAVMDGIYGIEEVGYHPVPATIIECGKNTDVLMFGLPPGDEGRLGTGDCDVFLRDNDNVVMIGSEPVEVLSSAEDPDYGDEPDEDAHLDNELASAKKLWGVHRIVRGL